MYKEMSHRSKALLVKQNPSREKMGSYEYYSLEEPGVNYPKFCRAKVDGHKVEVVLDLNEMDMANLGCMKISLDEKYVAYTLDTEGKEEYCGYIREIKSGKVQKLNGLVHGVEWAGMDVPVLYYTVPDDYLRPCKVYRHQLNTQMHELVSERWCVLCKSIL